MQYKNDDGLRIRVMSYGFADETGFYTISYRAPYLHYYGRDEKDFSELVNSLIATLSRPRTVISDGVSVGK